MREWKGTRLMAQLHCEACGEIHNFTAENLARLVQEFQVGNMHLVSRDFPYRWVKYNDQKVIVIKPRCLKEASGVTTVTPKKRGRPRKDEQRT